MSGLTSSPPLNAATGVSSASGSTSISIPRGGRPLVTANSTPASCSRWTASTERAVSAFSELTSVPSTSESSRRMAGGDMAGAPLPGDYETRGAGGAAAAGDPASRGGACTRARNT